MDVMGILDRFRRKKEQVTEPMTKTVREPVKGKPSLLRQLCGEDIALYEEMARLMYLDPRDKGTYEEAMKKAEEAEKKGNNREAKRNYRHAGALALYEKNPEGVVLALSKLGEYDRIMEVPEKAIEKAHEHYLDPVEGLKTKDDKGKK